MFCCDTDAIITAWRDTYPPDIAPGFWEQLDSRIKDGLVLAPEEVRKELRAPDDLKAWAKDRDSMFRELDDELQGMVQVVVAEMQTDARRKGLRLRDRDFKADPFVVALALLTDRTVITQEIRNQSPQGRPKIPNICDWFGLECTNMLGFMRQAGIRLR